jgi:phosphatidylinositol alpha-mannosyltransferase
VSVRPLRIAITNPTCWPQVRRGSERLLHELSHWLAARGHAVTVISTEPGDRRVESDGPVRRVLLSQRDPLAVRGRGCNFFHRFGWQLRRVLCEDDYDAVHCLNYHDAGGALLARRRGARFRLVYQLVGVPMRRYFRRIPLDGLLFRSVLRYADVVAGVSGHVTAGLRQEYGCEGRLLPPPTSMDAGAPILKSPADGVLRILFVGDLDEPRKGARLLAAAFARVKQALPAARLEYSGSASDAIRNAILAEVPEATRPDVIFHGVGFVEELPFLYARATVVVNPAVWEAIGMVLMEALATGTPVVGCDHAGTPDIVDRPGIGYLFPPGPIRQAAATNVEGLSAAILRGVALALRPETAAACRARVEEFAWSQLGPRYEAALAGTDPFEPTPTEKEAAGCSCS